MKDMGNTLEENLQTKNIQIKQLSGTSKNFLVTADDKKYLLKIFPGWPIDEVKYEFEVLNFLQSNKNTSQIIPKAINYFDKINNSPALLLEYSPGEKIGDKKINQKDIEIISKSLALLHEALSNKDFGHKYRFKPFDVGFLKLFPAKNQNYLVNFLTKYKLPDNKTLENLPQTIIHDDISTDNILITSGGLKIIDTSEAHRSYRISDIATSIFELILTEDNINFELIKTFLETYNENSSKRLTSQEIELIPFLITRRCLFILGYYTSKSFNSKDYKEYIKKYERASDSLRKNMDYLITLISTYE